MKFKLTTLVLLISLQLIAQENKNSKLSEFIVTPEFMLGISAEANDFFPERDLQQQYIIGFSRRHTNNPQEWAYWLKAPKTGLLLGYTNLGNQEDLGAAISIIPFIEFGVFNRKKKDMSVLVGMGASYFNTKYDPIENPFNQAIVTDVTWAFRASFIYTFLQTEKLDYRFGVTYSHHSNGHTRLPNQGLNSFLGSLSVDIKNPYRLPITQTTDRPTPEKSKQDYFSFRYGSGRNSLALAFNDKKAVQTFAGEYGRIFNNTFKIGLGAYYRFYEHYYDYIRGNESLVQDGMEFEDLKDNPRWNASALGLYINGEVLLNHFGIEAQIGANLFKPAYRIDWRINEGWDNAPRVLPPNWVLGEYDTKFRLKHIISSRMGLKYYLIGTQKRPKHNVFLAAHINSNLGQADFSEVSFGYVLRFNKS